MLSPPLSALVGAPVFLSVSPLSFVVWFHFPFPRAVFIFSFSFKRGGSLSLGI